MCLGELISKICSELGDVFLLGLYVDGDAE